MNIFRGKWKYSEYVPEGITLNGREFLITPENEDTGGNNDIALVLQEENARLIAAAPEMYSLLDNTHKILHRFKVKHIIDAVDLADLVRKTALVLNRVEGLHPANEDEIEDGTLSPCPKCGNEDLELMRIQEVNGLKWYRISCKDCGNVAVWSQSIDEAMSLWGTETVND